MTDVDPGVPRPALATRPNARPRRYGPVVAVVLVGATLVLLLTRIITNGPAKNPAYQPIKACEAYLLDQLKAPPTTTFSLEQFFDGDPARVLGYIDTPHSSSAVLGSPFVCSMVQDGNDWTVSDGHLLSGTPSGTGTTPSPPRSTG